MNCTQTILLLVLGAFGGDERENNPQQPATATEQFNQLAKEFNEAANAYYVKATNDEERTEPLARMVELSPRILALVEKNPKDPIALDALVQVVTQELWLVNNSLYPGRGKDNLEARAIALLLRDHVQSDKVGETCRRMSYGFSKDCELFLRAVLEKNPHKDVQALACLRLAQYLNGRLQRLDLLKEQPEMAERYAGWFGKDYVTALIQGDRAATIREAEAYFERAATEFGDFKLPYAETVGKRAKSELHEIRHLSVGREAPETEGPDQDGKPLKLSDYRGKVVLLYFWSEY